MKIFYLAIAATCIILPVSINAQTWQWAAKAGGTGYDYVNGIDIDNSGNSYITGKFRDSISFNSTVLVTPGLWSVYLAKYDAGGNLIWAKIAASDSLISVSGIKVDRTGCISITGQFIATATFGSLSGNNLTSVGDYDVFVAKYDGTGNFIWAKSFGGQGIDYAGGISTDNDGNIFLTGDFHFSSFPYSSSKIFLAKYDSTGNSVWLKTSMNYGTDHFGNGLKTDSAGNSFITGEFFNTLVFDSSVIIDAGNVESNIFLAKFDSSGTILWGQKAGASSGYCGSKAIDIDSAGNSFITGYYHGTISFGSFNITSTMGLVNELFVAKCNSGGNFEWVNQSVGAGSSRIISVDNSGGIFLCGTFSQGISFGVNSLLSAGSNDVFISKIDPSGNFIWATSIGGKYDDYAGCLKANSNGIFVTGNFSDTIYFDSSHTLVANSAMNTDIFISKLNTSSGVEEESEVNGLTIFPNPSNGIINFLTNKKMINGILNIYNSTGETIYKKILRVEKISGIQIEGFIPGIYFVEVIGDGTRYCQKIVVD